MHIYRMYIYINIHTFRVCTSIYMYKLKISMHLYTCIVCVYIYIYIIYIYIDTCKCTHPYIYTRTHTCFNTIIFIYIYIYTYIHMYIYTYRSIYVHIYVYLLARHSRLRSAEEALIYLNISLHTYVHLSTYIHNVYMYITPVAQSISDPNSEPFSPSTIQKRINGSPDLLIFNRHYLVAVKRIQLSLHLPEFEYSIENIIMEMRLKKCIIFAGKETQKVYRFRTCEKEVSWGQFLSHSCEE